MYNVHVIIVTLIRNEIYEEMRLLKANKSVMPRGSFWSFLCLVFVQINFVFPFTCKTVSLLVSSDFRLVGALALSNAIFYT